MIFKPSVVETDLQQGVRNDKYRQRYRVQRVLCHRCGDVAEYGEGTGVSVYELAKDDYGRRATCRCGYVWLYPFQDEANRIVVNYDPFEVNKPDDVEDLSVKWAGEPEPQGQIEVQSHCYHFCYGHAPCSGVCSGCKGGIPEGSEFIRLWNDFDIKWLHPACVEKEMSQAVRERSNNMKEYVIVGVLRSATPKKSWHQEFIGQEGQIEFNAVATLDGKRTLFFEWCAWSEERQDFDEHKFETTPGIAKLEGNLLAFTSAHTVYVFEVSFVGEKAFTETWNKEQEMTKEKDPMILRNRAKCLLCGDSLESVSQHDYQTCICGNLSVDGGTAYIRREYQKPNSYEELSEYDEG